jgi:hypothetical protein
MWVEPSTHGLIPKPDNLTSAFKIARNYPTSRGASMTRVGVNSRPAMLI